MREFLLLLQLQVLQDERLMPHFEYFDEPIIFIENE